MAIYRGAGGPGDATTDAANEATVASNKATEAAASAAAAAASESAAASSASSASFSASAASSSATAAASSASSASSSASSASSSATAAANSAIVAAASQVAAETAETNAAASEAAAAASKTAAAASETAAASSASAASSSDTSAASSATSASGSATAAAASALAAASSESHAASSEAAAATSESNAASSATNAASSATAAAGSATNAANSASAAATSATNASNSASAASTSASNAATSATAAQAAQAAAEDIFDQFGDQYLGAKASDPTTDNDGDPLNSGDIYWNTTNNTLRFYNGTAWVAPETVATTAATNASNSATASASSATSAANSATAAAASESNAATSESNAATSASNASTSASNAATSATNASNSASAAATSATSAANSATSAASSATAAAASYDAFDDRYLGSKSSAPTVDNDGNALLTGALYFDTSTSSMKVYSGSAWLDAYASLSGALIASNNLSDLTSASTARTNLGLGTAATTASTDYATAAQGALADSALQDITGQSIEDLADVDTMTPSDGQLLTWNSTTNKWNAEDAPVSLPTQTGNSGKYLTTDGTTASWDALAAVANSGAYSDLSGVPTNVSTFTNDSGYLTGNQTITLSGDVSGSGTTSITVTVADDSHNHIISNVDGLQTALDAKAPLASPALTGTPTAPTAAVGTNTTQLATTAFVNAEIANDAPTKTGGGASGTWGISITGNAATATTAGQIDSIDFRNGNSTNGTAPDNITSNGTGYVTSVSLYGQTDGSLYSQAYNTSWVHQIYGDYRTGQLAVRGKNNGTWQSWRNVLDSGNYNSYAPTLTGTGASGTWGISVTGNAATATTLQTARTINGTSFNGSADITTANWGTARTINGVSINGSTNYTIEPYIEDDEATNATRYLVFTDTTTAGYKRLNEDSGLNYNPSTGTLTATAFVGDGSALTGVSGGQYYGTAATKAIQYNAQTIAENITILGTHNAGSFGPITINSGYTVTVNSGAVWTIV